MTYKVVYNSCYGGFSISEAAYNRMVELNYNAPKDVTNYCGKYYFNIERHHPLLVQVVEEFIKGGKEAGGDCSRLAIEEIDVPVYEIKEYDGKEYIETPSGDWHIIK